MEDDGKTKTAFSQAAVVDNGLGKLEVHPLGFWFAKTSFILEMLLSTTHQPISSDKSKKRLLHLLLLLSQFHPENRFLKPQFCQVQGLKLDKN